MRRSTSSSALLVLTAAASLPAPGVASAAGSMPGAVDLIETFDAGEACSFPIEVHTTGKSGFIEVPNYPTFSGIATAPNARVTVANTDTGESVTVNATGAFRFVTTADGGLQILAGGKNFLYGVPEVGATALATSGPISGQISRQVCSSRAPSAAGCLAPRISA